MRVRDRVHNDQLPPSYYVDTARDKAPFRRLEGQQKADVCIVGGGVTGVSSALMLAEKGLDVVLLEQNQIGWGATGRSGGQLLVGYGPDLSDLSKMVKLVGDKHLTTFWEMGVECVCIARDFINRYQIDCDLKWGYFDAAMNKREVRNLTNHMAVLQERGYPHHLYAVGPEGVGDIVGSDRFIGGLVDMGSGHVHPLDLVRGEARAAESRGARIFEDARVSKIDYGPTVRLTTDTGYVDADAVFLAGNAYLGKLNKYMARRVAPVGSYMMATEPLGDDLAREILPSDYAVCDQRTALDYFRLSADKRLLFGGLATYSGLHPKSIEKALRPNMEKVFPQLGHVAVSYSWGGYLGVGLNRTPQIGRVTDNVYYAQAYSGHGLGASHMSARLVTEAMAGQLGRFDIVSKIKHRPLPGGSLLRHPIMALGMMWYRLKDGLGL